MASPRDDDGPTPRTTPDLFNHEAAERAFLEAWTSGRLAHAWLICGPRGVGKATLAYRIARFVLSGGGDGGGLFGGVPESLSLGPDHPVFRRVASGGHADLKVIERGWTDEKKTKLRSEILVDEVRGVGTFLSLTPAEGGWRVVIVDSADEMNRSGANAILKVLEEPPRRALLLLISHSPGRLLPTIRSRCRRLLVKPLPETTVISLLQRNQPGLTEADAKAIARLSEGSIGKALAFSAEGGLDLYREMVGLLSGLPRLDVAALHAFGDKMSRGEDAFVTVSELFLWWLARAVTLVGSGVWAEGEVIPGEESLQRRLIGMAGLDRWIEVWDKTTHLFGRTDAVNLDRKLAVMNAFFAVERLCRP